MKLQDLKVPASLGYFFQTSWKKMNGELSYCGYEISPSGKFGLDFQNQYKNLKNIRYIFQEEFQLVYIIVLKTSETKIVKVTISRFCADVLPLFQF